MLTLEYNSYYQLQTLWAFVKNLHAQLNQPLVIFQDEFEVLIKSSEPELEVFWKIVMDGAESLDNCLFLATTNHFKGYSLGLYYDLVGSNLTLRLLLTYQNRQ